MKGLELCEGFFHEEAVPLLQKYFPELAYTAGLLGYGSDVLGYDDETSTDHMWGPRFYLFLDRKDLHYKSRIEEVFSEGLPYSYLGYSVNFSEPDPEDNGVRHAMFIQQGKISPLIFIEHIDDFIESYIGRSDLENLDILDWLTFSEHRLLALTSGKIFKDMLGIKDKLRVLSFYPEKIKRYLLASNWAIISEEQAFVRRCADCNDDIGSRIITARIAERLIRLCFLYRNRYAPYSKWMGTAFRRLEIGADIFKNIEKALSAGDIAGREEALVAAQKLVGDLHNQCKITKPVECSMGNYFGRNIKVIRAERFAEAIMEQLKGTPFEGMPLISTFSQVGNLTALTENNSYTPRVKEIYRTKGGSYEQGNA
jgi:hypothetical protein